MSDDNLLTRREFTLESALAILSAATISISCGGDDNPTTTPTNSGDEVGSISANHGHIAIVQSAQLTSPTTITVDIRGNATHPHLIELSSSQLAMMSDNGRVSVVSTTDEGHNHTVTFN